MSEEKIYVNGAEDKRNLAIESARKYAAEKGFNEAESRRLQLLTEELIGMLGGITSDEYTAMFWIDGEGRQCSLHLLGKTEMTATKREELLAAASSGRNSEAVGIMGKIREMVTSVILNWNESMKLQDEYGVIPAMDFYTCGVDMTVPAGDMMTWTLSNYRDAMADRYEDEVWVSQNDEKKEAWDELERSVIANLADDVKVGIRKDTVEITVIKAF